MQEAVHRACGPDEALEVIFFVFLGGGRGQGLSGDGQGLSGDGQGSSIIFLSCLSLSLSLSLSQFLTGYTVPPTTRPSGYHVWSSNQSQRR